MRLPLTAVGSVFSTRHPELRLELQNRMEIPGDRVLLDVRCQGPLAGEWADEVAVFPEVLKVEVYPEDPESATYRLTLRTPIFHAVLREQRVLARYPITIERGWGRFETVATASQIRRTLAALQRRVGPSHVEAVRRGSVTLGGLGLSRSQEEIFRAAISGGFFDSPRGLSLTSLAAQIGKSKSAVSEAIRKIQHRLAESALQIGLVTPGLGL
jgi:predicted DNA binding protein